jgi:uracil phosphoribosyltransferase
MKKEKMMKNDFNKLPDIEKQKVPSTSEVDPKMATVKTTISAVKAAQKYKLKGLNLDIKK